METLMRHSAGLLNPSKLAVQFIVYGLAMVFLSLPTAAQKHGTEVEIGSPKILEYSRVFPLLDGLFQDVAATQVSALALSPNAPNAASLDALQQVFALQLQYSATAGVQNGLAAQQSSVASNYAVFQNLLLQQQSTLLAAQVNAQNQLGKAQLVLDSLVNPTDAEKTTATQQVTVAKDNLDSVTSQLGQVQGTLAKNLTVSPSFKDMTTNAPASTPTLSNVAPTIPPAPDKFSPNFPATKQMDNQITLLWERLARLVETLNQGNDQNEDVYLVELDTNIVPYRRKHQLLNVRYNLTCDAGMGRPRVIDMYPRNAAVNVLDEKYRETRFGLGALLSFFSVGLNASYNRDHLKISQSLSQSSYITGYGVGGSSVGWLYGISLGDDAITPGVRSVYALVSIPKSCSSAKIEAPLVEWTKDPAMSSPGASVQHDEHDVALDWTTAGFPRPTDASRTRCPKGGCVSKVVYSPIEYDSGSQTGVMVTVSLDPSTASLDKEEIININGRYLQRARDNFGRAISTTGITGSGGILESGTLGVNTWLPVSSTTFVMNLDAISFGGKFPNISLQSPSGVIDLSNSFVLPSKWSIESVDKAKGNVAVYYGNIIGGGENAYKGQLIVVDGFSENPDNNGTFMCAGSSTTSLTLTNDAAEAERSSAGAVPDRLLPQIIISGTRWRCTTECGDILPPLAQPKATKSRIIVNRWTGNTENGGTDQLSITVADSSTNQTTASPAAQGTSLQVITDDDRSVWSTHPVVELDLGSSISPLTNCRARGARLLCPLDQTWRSFDYAVRIVDSDHSKGPFVGEGPVRSCSGDCAIPFIWDTPTPSWNARKGAWTLDLTMANLRTGEEVILSNEKWSLKADPLTCDDYLQPCQVHFELSKPAFDKLTPITRLQVSTSTGERIGPRYDLLILTSISPKVTAISSQQDDLRGTNLVFDQIKVGPSGNSIPMICDDTASHCQLKAKYSQNDKGFLYFSTATSIVPVVLSADGSQVLHDPAAIKAATQASVAAKGVLPQSGTPQLTEKKQSVPVYQSQ
jgi:hypothetical protein